MRKAARAPSRRKSGHRFHLIADLETTLLFSCISSYEIFIQTAVGSAICLSPLQIWAEQFYDLLA